MALVPEWRRRVVGAAGVGLAAPGAVVAAAIAVGFGGGGVRGLDNLGQAVTGPVIPDTRGLSAGGTREGQPRADLLADTREARRRARRPRAARIAAAAPARVRRSAPAAGTPAPTTGSRGGSTGLTGGRNDGAGGSGGSDNGGSRKPTRTPPPAASQPAPTQPASQPPAPAPEPNGPLAQATEPVEDIVEQVPVVGPTAAQVVGGLVDAADGLLNPPPAP